ncbi:10008_t:CDS:2, partial [Paraglomus occultum]
LEEANKPITQAKSVITTAKKDMLGTSERGKTRTCHESYHDKCYSPRNSVTASNTHPLPLHTRDSHNSIRDEDMVDVNDSRTQKDFSTYNNLNGVLTMFDLPTVNSIDDLPQIDFRKLNPIPRSLEDISSKKAKKRIKKEDSPSLKRLPKLLENLKYIVKTLRIFTAQ